MDNKPIGCRAFHFTRKVGEHDVCFYCGEKIYMGLLASIPKDYIYTPGSSLTLEKLNEFLKITDEAVYDKNFSAQMNAMILLECDDKTFTAMYLSNNMYFLGTSTVWDKIDERAKKLKIYKNN